MKKILTPLLFLLTAGYTQAQFIENKGQVLDVNHEYRPEVQFYYGMPDASLYFLKDRVVYAFRQQDPFDAALYANNARALDSARAKLGYTMHRIDMAFVGANPNPEMVKGEKQPGDIHFYLDKRNGIRNVGSYKTVTYKNLYPNIDVVFYELPTGLKYDIVLREGAHIEDVKIAYEGAKSVRPDNGKVVIETSYKTLEERIPLAYADGNTANAVEMKYIVGENGSLSFEKPAQAYQTLTIDPVLEWATYFNGSAAASGALSYDQNHLDDQGNFYIHGLTTNSANNYPVINPGGSAYVANYNAGYDIYLAKFNANRALVWSTYLGGSGSEYTYGSNSMASRGNVLHLVGEGMSAGAPFTNGGGFYQATADRNFWARFNLTTGQLQHLTTLGGGYKPSIAVSNSGLVAIIREAYDFNAPVVMNRAGAYNQATNGGFKDMFLMMFNATYAQTWGTYLGGPGTQEAFTCTFDNNENLYFVGENNWSGSGSNATTERLVNLPGAYYQATIAGGTDVTLGKFNTAGALVWHTLFGGNNSDARQGQQGGYAKILIHPTTQELVLMFNTTSNNLSTINVPGAYYKTVPTHPDFGGSSGSFWNYAAYIAKFSTAGAYNYGTYWYNTTDGDLIFDATFGGCDKLYIAGRVDYNTAVTQPLSAGFNLPNGQQTFMMQMNGNTYASEWTSFLAYNSSMQPSISGQTNTPRVYVSASGYYNNGPTVDAGNGAYYQATNINQPAGNPTAFAYNYMLWQLHPSLPPDVTGDLDLCSGETTTLTASGGTGAPYNWYATATSTPAFFTGSVYTTPALTGSTTYYVSSGSGMCESPRTAVTVTVTSGGGTPFTVTGGGTICTGGPGLNIGLNGSQGGVSYQLYRDGVAEGVPLNGTGTNLSFGTFNTAGTYTVVAGGSGSCNTNMTGSAVVTVITTPATPGFTVNSPVCSGSAILFNGPTLPGTNYFWSGPNGFASTVEDPQIALSTTAASGTYSLYVVSSSCTSATATQTVTVNPVPATPAFTVNTPICSGANLNFNGPTVAGATYVWSGPNAFTSAVEDPQIAAAAAAASGTYNLYVVAGGCTSATATQNVTVNPTPATPGFTVNSPLCGGGNLNFDAPTVAGATYVWSGPNAFTSSVEDPQIAAATAAASGTYNLYVVAGGCTSATATQNVTVSPTPATPNFTVNTPICSGSNLNFNGPTVAGATYVWSGPNAFTSAVEDPQIAAATAAASGTYNLYVVAGGCTSATATQTVTVNPTPAIALGTVTNPSGCGGNNGSIQITGTGTGNIGWTGTAFGGALSVNLPYTMSNLGAGTYNVIFATAAGCTSNVVVGNLVNPSAPATPAFTVNSPVCEGSALNFNGPTVAGATYVWSGPNAFTSSVEDPSIANTVAASAGTYSLYVVVSNCTSATATQSVTVNPLPATPTFTSNSPLCAGNTLNLTGPTITGATYVWSGPNAFTSALQSPSITGTTAAHTGTYNLYVVAGGCTSATATQNVTVNPVPAIAMGTVTPPTGCGSSDGSIQITGTGTGNIGWTGTATGFGTAITLPYTINNLGAGTYVIGFLSAAGCSSNVVNATLFNPSNPGTPTFTTNSPVCAGGNLQLTATPVTGATYVWGGPNAFTSGSANPSINPATAAAGGSYSLYVVVNNCTSATAMQTVTVNPLPATPNFTSNSPVCTGATLSFDGPTVAGATYAWSGPDAFTSTVENPSITGATTAATGTYSLTVTVNGCTSAAATLAATVNNIPPTPTVTTNSPVCEGGTLLLTANTPGATVYNWSGPNAFTSTLQNPTVNNVSAAAAGTYNVYSSLGTCTSATATIQITVGQKPTATYNGATQSCGNTAQLSAATSPLVGVTLDWYMPALAGSGPQFNYVHAGNVPATVNGFVEATNGNGCKDTTYFTLQLDDVPVAQFTAGDACDGISVQAVETHGWNGNGTNAAFEWFWQGGTSTAGNPIINLGGPGTYPVMLVVTNAGTPCKDTVIQNVTVKPVPGISFTHEGLCLQEVNFAGMATPDSIITQTRWDFGDGGTANGDSTSHTYANPGNYTVTFTVHTGPGCSFGMVQTVEVKLSKGSIPEGLPNVLSSNGDGLNDHIDFDEILGDCGEYEAIIYNRWGAPVFTQTNGTAPFKGKSKGGTDLSEGVYYYVLRYGDSQKSGNITLAR